jgi:hypothetical protein
MLSGPSSSGSTAEACEFADSGLSDICSKKFNSAATKRQ